MPNIKKCLIRKIDPNRIEEAFEQEHQEFYNEPSNGSGLSQHFMENEWKPFIENLVPGKRSRLLSIWLPLASELPKYAIHQDISRLL